MYKKMNQHLRMSANEASEKYPDDFILMRMDSINPSDDMGMILFIGDDCDELFSLVMKLDDKSNCGVVEGLNHMRSLGGIVVGS